MKTITTGASQASFDDLKKPITFAEFAEMCAADKEPPPTVEEYEDFLSAASTMTGTISPWPGIRFVTGARET